MRPVLWLFFLMPFGMIAQSVLPVAPAAPVHISGAINFRDIGGLRTQDGHVVRSGVIYRSGELSHLTQDDYNELAAIHVRFIYDLRTDAERTAAPTAWVGSQPEIVAQSVGFAAGTSPADMTRLMFSGGTDAAHVSQSMQAMTAKIAIDGAPAIGTILRDLARGDEPAIVHCTAGKDRTGIVTAVFLRLLGVPLDSVYDDYLRSNDSVAPQLARMRAASTSSGLPPQLAQLPPETIKVLMGVDRSYLQAAFEAMDGRYGSFDGFVRDGLGLSGADVSALRAALLVPVHGGSR